MAIVDADAKIKALTEAGAEYYDGSGRSRIADQASLAAALGLGRWTLIRWKQGGGMRDAAAQAKRLSAIFALDDRRSDFEKGLTDLDVASREAQLFLKTIEERFRVAFIEKSFVEFKSVWTAARAAVLEVRSARFASDATNAMRRYVGGSSIATWKDVVAGRLAPAESGIVAAVNRGTPQPPPINLGLTPMLAGPPRAFNHKGQRKPRLRINSEFSVTFSSPQEGETPRWSGWHLMLFGGDERRWMNWWPALAGVEFPADGCFPQNDVQLRLPLAKKLETYDQTGDHWIVMVVSRDPIPQPLLEDLRQMRESPGIEPVLDEVAAWIVERRTSDANAVDIAIAEFEVMR